MKRATSLVLLVCIVSCSIMAQQSTGGRLLAGAAEAKISPPAGTFLAGYNQNRKSTGVHDDIFVKAVALANSNNAIVIVVVDCIGLPYNVVQRIRMAVEEKIPSRELNAGQIVVSSTHTHSGPDVIGIWGADILHTGIDSTYLNFLVNTAAGVIVKAWKSKQPATAGYAVTSFGPGWVENVSDSNEVDREVTVLQFSNGRKKNIATLTNFACHPTILGNENTLISADYPSGLYKQLGSKFGGVNIFLQGAIGGWVQPDKIPRTFEEAEERGKGLANTVIDALKTAKALQGNNISFYSKQFEMPVANEQLKKMADANVIKRDIGDGTLTEIAWFAIGNALFATHPGETSPLYSFATKRLMTNTGPKFVIGLGLDELGYILKPPFFVPGTRLHAAPYLTGMSVGKDAGDTVMEVLESLAEKNK